MGVLALPTGSQAAIPVNQECHNYNYVHKDKVLCGACKGRFGHILWRLYECLTSSKHIGVADTPIVIFLQI